MKQRAAVLGRGEEERRACRRRIPHARRPNAAVPHSRLPRRGRPNAPAAALNAPPLQRHACCVCMCLVPLFLLCPSLYVCGVLAAPSPLPLRSPGGFLGCASSEEECGRASRTTTIKNIKTDRMTEKSEMDIKLCRNQYIIIG